MPQEAETHPSNWQDGDPVDAPGVDLLRLRDDGADGEVRDRGDESRHAVLILEEHLSSSAHAGGLLCYWAPLPQERVAHQPPEHPQNDPLAPYSHEALQDIA